MPQALASATIRRRQSLALATRAREKKITQVLIGRPRLPRFFTRTRSSIVYRIMSELGDVDVSTDGGSTWTKLTAGLPNELIGKAK